MSRSIIDEQERLRAELHEIDRQRDHLRAQLADVTIRVRLHTLKRIGVMDERIGKLEQKIAVRAERRRKELERFGEYMRPGTWDDDLDVYQELSYEETVEGGYTMRFVRSMAMCWIGQVILPRGHRMSGGPDKAMTDEFPSLFHELNRDDRIIYSFFGPVLDSAKPRPNAIEVYTERTQFSAEETGEQHGKTAAYMDYAENRARCIRLVDYLKTRESE